MIKKIELLSNQKDQLTKAIQNIDFVIGSMYDLQILISTDLKNQLSSLLMQGGKIAEVNEERKESGLHALNSVTNDKIISKDWNEVIEKGEGIVFCFLMDHNRQRMNARFKLAIDMTLDSFPEIKFDLHKSTRADYFLIYEGEDLKTKKAPQTEGKTAKKTKKSTKEKKQSD